MDNKRKKYLWDVVEYGTQIEVNVWNTIKNHLPKLIHEVEQMLGE
jgi:hypothetical protein